MSLINDCKLELKNVEDIFCPPCHFGVNWGFGTTSAT